MRAGRQFVEPGSSGRGEQGRRGEGTRDDLFQAMAIRFLQRFFSDKVTSQAHTATVSCTLGIYAVRCGNLWKKN